MTAAEDLHRRQETETALGRLHDGRPYTRRGLFSRIERWQEALIRRLLDVGLIETAGRSSSRGNPVMYQMKDERMVQNLLDDEELLLQMVFPSYKPAPDPEDLAPMLPGISDVDETSVKPTPPVANQAENLQQALESSDVMSPEILLKLLLGMIEILNNHTEQLDELTAKVDALDDKVSKLLKELTG
jgi:hypothetical protein